MAKRYSCAVIYGWYEGDLKVWDEMKIEVVTKIESELYIKIQAMSVFTNTIAQAMGEYAFAFVDSIEEEPELEEQDRYQYL